MVSSVWLRMWKRGRYDATVEWISKNAWDIVDRLILKDLWKGQNGKGTRERRKKDVGRVGDYETQYLRSHSQAWSSDITWEREETEYPINDIYHIYLMYWGWIVCGPFPLQNQIAQLRMQFLFLQFPITPS